MMKWLEKIIGLAPAFKKMAGRVRLAPPLPWGEGRGEGAGAITLVQSLIKPLRPLTLTLSPREREQSEIVSSANILTKQKGYTLTELSISTSIIAMLAVGGLSIMEKKNETDRYKETYRKLQTIESAVKGFVRSNRYVPCPALASSLESNTLFGKSVAYNTSTGICDGSGLANGTGAVPVRTLNLGDDYSYDGWGRKFMYRSSDFSGAAADFDIRSFHGDLAIVDRNGTHKTSINELAPNNNGAIYVIVSYGGNGKNVAFRKNNTTAPSQATGVEGANTDHTRKVYVQSELSDSFDDIVTYGMKKSIIAPKKIAPPIQLDSLTCENAHAVLSGGRSETGLVDFATAATTDEADHLFKVARQIAYLCDNAPTLEKVPANLTGLTFWYDASDPHTIFSDIGCAANPEPAPSGQVACWKDKSANGYNATNNTANARPITFSRTINGTNALDFNGTKGLGTAATIDFSATNAVTLFIVHQNDTTTLTNTATLMLELSNNFNSFSDSFYVGYENSSLSINGLSVGMKGNVGYNLASHNQFYLTPIIDRVELDTSKTGADEVKIYKDGTLLSDDATTNTTYNSNNTNSFSNLRNLYIGARNNSGSFFDGAMGEIIGYSRLLSTKESEGVENYLSDKWGIPIAVNTNLCPTGQVFAKDSKHPEGSCQCPEGKILLQEISSESACFIGASLVLNGCVSLADIVPTYTTPPTINGQTLWLDANDCSTIKIQGTAHRVREWRDKSPRKNDVTQVADASRPAYIPGILNGHGVVRFDGNDILTRASVLGSNLLSNTAATVIIVQKYNSPNHASASFNWAVDASNQLAVHALDSNGFLYFDFGDATNSGRFSFNPKNINFTDVFKIITVQKDTDGSSVVYVNGSEVKLRETLTATLNTTLSAALQIGSTLNGDIGEITVYSRSLADAERDQIESYLSEKWDIFITPKNIATLEAWYDASQKTTLFSDESCGSNTVSNNSDIACWKDLSGYDHHIVQANVDKRPKFRTSANGKKSKNFTNNRILFDGDNVNAGMGDVLSALDNDVAATNRMDILGDMSIFAVVRMDNFSATAGIISKTTGSIATPFDFNFDNSGLPALMRASGIGSVDTAVSINTKTMLEVVMNGTVVKHYKNGALTATGSINTTPVASSTGLDVGNRNNGTSTLAGAIYELQLYNGAVTDIKRREVEDYLAAKWNITLQ